MLNELKELSKTEREKLLSGRMAYAINVAMADKANTEGFRLGSAGAIIPVYRFVANGTTRGSKYVNLHFTSIKGVLHVTVEARQTNAHGEQTFASVPFALNQVLDLMVCLSHYDNLISVQSRDAIQELVNAIHLNYLKAGEE